MKILIDFTQIPIQKAGVGTYALNLVLKIPAIDKENTYYLLIQDDEKSFDSIGNQRLKLIKLKSVFFRRFILRSIMEQFYISYLVLKHKIDIVHSLHYSFPIFLKAKRVVTIHDMALFKFPDKHLFIKVYYFRFFIYLASKLADKVITVSKSTLNDFSSKFNVDKGKVVSIYHGANMNSDNLDQVKNNFVKRRYALPEKYFLFLGTIEPRKNIRTLLLAFHKFLEENDEYYLVIAGKKMKYFNDTFQLIEKLQIENRVILTGYIDEDEKPYLISGAKIFIYPSLYEGFGISVLEALACGIPTITSNTSSLAEVAGDAAVLIDPLNADELYFNIKRLLNDEALCNQYKKKAIEQAEKFSWEKTAKETIDVYASLPRQS